MKKCRSCSLPDRRLLPAKGEPTDVQKYIFLLGLSSHVMLMLAYSVAWKSTIRRGQSMPADWPYLVYALFIPSLCLVYTLFMPSMWVWCDMRSSHVMPTMACAMADIYGCGLSLSSVLLSKPDIAYRGGVILSGLGNDGHKIYASLGQNTLMGIEMRISL